MKAYNVYATLSYFSEAAEQTGSRIPLRAKHKAMRLQVSIDVVFINPVGILRRNGGGLLILYKFFK